MTNPEERVSSTSTIIECGVAAVAVIAMTVVVRWMRSRPRSLKSYLISNPPRDTVILYQYGKALTVPSISPFVMKLETYMRVAKIPYINDYSRKPGPKGKLPWIQYNNLVVPDSQLCVQFLNAQRGVNLNSSLSPGQEATGHLVRRTVEDSLYWSLLIWRMVFETSGQLYLKLGVPKLVLWYMRRVAKPRLWSQGIGRFTKEEVTQLMENDLSAISQILGENKFLFGNTVGDVTEFDCALFGQLCQLVWQMPGTPIGVMIVDKYPNLVRFCSEMRTSFWYDWDHRLLTPTGSSSSHTSLALKDADSNKAAKRM